MTTAPQLRLLAGLLAAPTEESLSILEELVTEHPWLQAATTELATLSLEAWQAEHTRLFINGHPKTCCPPFASVYRHKVMNSPLCDRLELFYQSVGLVPIAELPPDYLGNLLECGAYLLEHTDLSQWQTLQDTFLKPWITRFCQDLQQSSHLVLYRQLGQQLQQLF
jgi:TorA maturation chaperone TorD